MNVDVNDPEAVAIARSMFPDAEILSHTRWQQLTRGWNRALHRVGLHDFIPTYLLLAEDRVVKQYCCSICHRPGGPAEELR